MRFEEAMQEARRGRKVRRAQGDIILYREKVLSFGLSDADIWAEDWEIVRVPITYYKAFRMMTEEGKVVEDRMGTRYRWNTHEKQFEYKTKLDTWGQTAQNLSCFVHNSPWYEVEEK
jgi:hypothetical protein